MNINIRPDESVTIIGKKGSGKTQLLLALIRNAKPAGTHRYVILDTKQVGDFKEYPTCSRLKDLPDLVSKNFISVYAPNSMEVNSDEYLEGFFHWCYNRYNTTVVIDELTSIVHGDDTPDSYKDITDRGRAKHVTIWQGNQKPVHVPHAALSEADHFFVFQLLVESARKKMSGILGRKVMERPKDRYGFWYYHSDFKEPVYCPGMKLD